MSYCCWKNRTTRTFLLSNAAARPAMPGEAERQYYCLRQYGMRWFAMMLLSPVRLQRRLWISVNVHKSSTWYLCGLWRAKVEGF
mmetsp:Transcript_43271/g.122320  ORF Transcript_43271/g.122320 Transcript_43271/m.122320 type:complete len:84 (-) Transcript_43271:40-291(-)